MPPITATRTQNLAPRLVRTTLVVAVMLLLGCACSAAQASTLRVKATGPGTVSIAPTGVASTCPDAYGWCRFLYPPRLVTLIATAVGDSASFAGWLGDCAGSQQVCQLRMDGTKTAVARFSPVQLHVGRRLGGTTDVDGGTSCGDGCWVFAYGAVATLTARPEEGRMFASWNGWCAGSSSTCERPVYEPADTTAFFGCLPGVDECVDQDQSPIDIPLKVRIRRRGPGSLLVNGKVCARLVCDTTVERGQRIAIKPRKGGRFIRWDGGACQGPAGWCFFAAFRDDDYNEPSVTAVFA
jgi:hypothetical protein